jgi:hypothetical protein
MVALPGVPRLRLWGEALEASGRSREDLERAYAGDDEWDKWDVPLSPAQVVPADGLRLAGIYVLVDGPEIAITPYRGAEAADALFSHTYRGDYVQEVGTAEQHWRTVTALLRTVPVFRLQRPRELTRLDALGAALLAHAERQTAPENAEVPSCR